MNERLKSTLSAILLGAMVCAIIYVSVSGFAYALRHPELTDTQRFLSIYDAMLWR